MGNGQWTMDNGQCENLADDTMASYHEVPYLSEDRLHHCPLSILPSCVPHCPLSIVHCPLPTAPSGWGLIRPNSNDRVSVDHVASHVPP
ncbi:MAG: hypothetical protein LBB49_00970 [Gracilibacteraceae bacterium]|nr:hypothetical protein [Gracilibacteraceae bacterium]